MARLVSVESTTLLADFESYAHLEPPAARLRADAARVLPQLRGRVVWMINSTAQGGGVAEMLPRQITVLRELGVQVEWAVITTDRPAFFDLTKRLHNMIHGADVRLPLTDADRELWEAVSRENAAWLAERIGACDVVVVHDPQPLVCGMLLKRRLGVRTIWRCHIGFGERTPVTAAAWRFMRPVLETYDHAVFTTRAYVPGFLADRASVIRPAIDPLSEKNRYLATHRLVEVLSSASLAGDVVPPLAEPFRAPAVRLGGDGRWMPARSGGDLGLLTGPIVTQISRWDRLKGFEPLLEAFVRLKRREMCHGDERRRRRIALTRLVLAGPDPASVTDDPEGQDVLDALAAAYRRLEPPLRQAVALVALPMASATENALMVNALQRCSTVVVQNSIREGFGLTVTEAMWKGVPVVVSPADGLREQVTDGREGRMIGDPHDADDLARVLAQVLGDPHECDGLGRRAQRRVASEFTLLVQLAAWLRTLGACVRQPVQGIVGAERLDGAA
jgi:trehalose synthase